MRRREGRNEGEEEKRKEEEEGSWKSSIGGDEEEDEAGEEEGSSCAAVAELVSSLKKERVLREVTLALCTGLRDASADFSFLRLRGLRSLLTFLRSLPDSDSDIRLFRHTQSLPHLQVVPVIFQNSLKQSKTEPVLDLDRIFTVEPLKITSPSTDAEVALALRVVEGCCLLNKESSTLAHDHKAIKVLLNILMTRGTLEQAACLDALISIMLDSPTNQTDFEAWRGVDKITELIKNKEVDENIRIKCAEFLLLLIGHVNVRDRPPMASIHAGIRMLLGEKCASLIWAASQFGSTLDPEQRLTALHIQARRVLESLEMY